MCHRHKFTIVHRDLPARTILLTAPGELNIAVTFSVFRFIRLRVLSTILRFREAVDTSISKSSILCRMGVFLVGYDPFCG
jgi:hypothetical protein